MSKRCQSNKFERKLQSNQSNVIERDRIIAVRLLNEIESQSNDRFLGNIRLRSIDFVTFDWFDWCDWLSITASPCYATAFFTANWNQSSLGAGQSNTIESIEYNRIQSKQLNGKSWVTFDWNSIAFDNRIAIIRLSSIDSAFDWFDWHHLKVFREIETFSTQNTGIST